MIFLVMFAPAERRVRLQERQHAAAVSPGQVADPALF
jgi:hypothetical protein